MIWHGGRWWVLGAVLIAVGCTDRPTGSSEGTTEAATSDTTDEISADGTSGASTGSTSDAVDSTSSGSDEGDLDDGPCGHCWCSVPGDDSIAHCTPDGGGVSFECDLFAQDCPAGEKCSPWANDGGAAWNATRCSPIVPAPDPVGAVCTVEGSGASGLDSCELGAQCWDVDPDTLEGVCVAMCQGDETNPLCEDPETTCVIANDGAIVLCLPSCDPLQQSCEDGHACINEPGNARWVCTPVSGEPSADGGPCEYLNVCGVGSVCADSGVVPGCGAVPGCCTPLCDVTSGAACTLPGSECVPWYEPGALPPGLEAVGLCSAVTEPPAEGWSPFEHMRANDP